MKYLCTLPLLLSLFVCQAQKIADVDTLFANDQQIALLDKKTASWTTYEYNDDGQLQRIETLSEVVSESEYRTSQTNYYEDGKVYQRINKSVILDGERKVALEGRFVEYSETGRLKTVARYSKNKLHGVLQKFHEIGRLEQVHYYYQGKLQYIEYFDPRGNKFEMENSGNGAWEFSYWKNGSFCAGPSYKNSRATICD